ncbi:hypothetical protein EI555_007431 [Monodon monoceros]|uniref:Tr-type G domain-containing protein n=1 Tax=Monodon monoceros TaxID=40151 RepID=A0A4U1F7D7_MONMO|nr:hypothetical protein EI555_007431 [Monodon monoceros]
MTVELTFEGFGFQTQGNGGPKCCSWREKQGEKDRGQGSREQFDGYYAEWCHSDGCSSSIDSWKRVLSSATASEHLTAIEIMKLKHILILQNKIDLVKESQAKEQYEQILAFVQGTVAEGPPIILISAQLKYNIEVVCEYIVKKIPVPPRDFASELQLVIRSFDVNKPGCEVDDLKGDVDGGSILKGV